MVVCLVMILNFSKVESNTRVLDVIQQTLESNPDGGDPESFTLVQLLPNNRGKFEVGIE